MVGAVCAVLMMMKDSLLNPVMLKGVESVSVSAFPATAMMAELSEVQLALSMLVLT
jgi:hypothetical protein